VGVPPHEVERVGLLPWGPSPHKPDNPRKA
jgi:hypothetical protein